ncbi:hypothetical protein ES705_00594 [subsurface metagenome]|nr:DUF3800 domain-containing protein [Clostridia bacterium]
MEFNIYCDESRHLLNDKKDRYMVIGAIRINNDSLYEVNDDIEVIKYEKGYNTEIKWTRVSKQKLEFKLKSTKILSFAIKN